MEEEIQMKVDRLTENLKEWKHVILLADRWLKWEQDEYPIILSASITIGFFLFWFLNPPVISAIAFAAMCICVADYVVPRMKDFGFSEVGNCSAEDEVRYKAICNYIVRFQYYVTEKYNWAKKQRELKPKRFFLAALICLLFIGFIAGAIPNLLLMYMIVLFIVLLPGLHKKGYLLQWKIIFLQHFIAIVQKIREGRLK